MKIEMIVLTLVMVIFIALTAGCEVMKWKECRRVHPRWYCAMNGSK